MPVAPFVTALSSQRPAPRSSNATRIVLGRPALHLVLGAVFVLLFSWPILASDSPLTTWSTIFVAWALSLAVSFVLSWGEDEPDLDALEEHD